MRHCGKIFLVLSVVIVCLCQSLWAQSDRSRPVHRTYGQSMNQSPGLLMDLSGLWRFRLDPRNLGIAAHWYDQILKDSLKLPGSLQAQGYGNDVTAETQWYSGKLYGIWQTDDRYAKYRQPGNVKVFEWLQPAKHYIGAAWYQRDINIPAAWKDKHLELLLERVHWSSTVWVDGHMIGTKRSLATAQMYDLTDFLTPGAHRLSIRIDNSQIVDLGKIPHSVSDETQTAWNGVVGKIQLKATPAIWIENAQVYPDNKNKNAKVVITIGNPRHLSGTASLTMQTSGFNSASFKKSGKNARGIVITQKTDLSKDSTILVITYPMKANLELWSPEHPALYRLDMRLQGKFGGVPMKDSLAVVFGMREFTTKGTQFQLNGHPVSLRGDVNCALFPLTGYPQMDVLWWKKLFRVYRNWGLNAVHFHSWCPPEAAFVAADETGIYLEPEVDEWSHFMTSEQQAFFQEESSAMLTCYGNHPSFVMMALGNELNADTGRLYNLVNFWKKTDGRRVYSGKTAGYPVLNNFDFYNTGKYNNLPLRYHSGPQHGWPPPPGSTFFNIWPPATVLDYRSAIRAYGKPLVAHELGQRCSFPDVLGEPAKYSGFLKATYLDIAKDQLQEHGLLSRVPDFVRASGKWQIQLYKEEIEANMRTPGSAGLDLLSLEDFPGQGSALVGFLNAFYENKGYISPRAFRRFCGPQVILARIPKRILENNETFRADLEMYNYAETPIKAPAFDCRITDKHGKVIWKKSLPGKVMPIGNGLSIGSISLGLQTLNVPAKYNLSVHIPGTEIINDWDFWVYPSTRLVPAADTSGLIIAYAFDSSIEKQLEAGASVLLLPDSSHIRGALPICFVDFYWTAFGLKGGESSADGLLCDPDHPLFKYFPTSYHTDWQWWDLLTHAHPMILDDFQDPHPWPKSYQPLVQMIDSWLVNRKLGVVVEAKVGKGKLMVCSINLTDGLKNRPATRQFRYSLLRYMASKDFNPQHTVTASVVRQLFVPGKGTSK